MSEPVLYEQNGHIVTITLNRPEIHNAISDSDMVEAIVAALHRINADTSVRVAILTGAGKSFSSGGNLKAMKEGSGNLVSQSPLNTRNNYLGGIQRIPLAMYNLDVPVIAAVKGAAIGAGCDLACMCDIRVAGESARFAESFVKLGIIPGDGGAWFLPRIVGLSKACEMAFTGDPVDAQEALACGLVSKVVPDDNLLETANTLAGRIAANPPHAVRLTKRLIKEGQQVRLDTLLELSAALQALSHTTTDHKEALEAFLEKRSPTFKGE
jgi:enoyl-CoA hydratase/carnithine racemase